MLGGNRDRTRSITDPIAKAFAATGLSPNQLTVLQLLLTVPVAILLWRGSLIGAAFAMGAVASLDFVDGTVARMQGKVTKEGGYLDSMVDRFVDVLLLLPLLLRYDETRVWLAGAVFLFASTVTSFARARLFQDMRPPPAGTWSRDILERGDRITLLAVAVLVQGILDALRVPFELLFWALALLAVLAMLTVLQRMRTSMRLLREVDARGQ